MVEQSRSKDCNLVIVGHSNTGKSTLAGRILLDLNMVDKREVAKLKQEASKN
jgi:elongation factor 1 alpha-like protein